MEKSKISMYFSDKKKIVNVTIFNEKKKLHSIKKTNTPQPGLSITSPTTIINNYHIKTTSSSTINFTQNYKKFKLPFTNYINAI